MARKPTYEELEQRVKELDKEASKRKQTEEALREKTHDLGERVKELNCLYGIFNLTEKPGISLEEILQGAIDLIPPAWQYPEITCTRITLEGQIFHTNNFKETIWKQTSDIIMHGGPIGVLEVYYLEERPESDEGPFLKEERVLINAIAGRLGQITERKQAQEALRKERDFIARIMETSPVCITMANREGQIIFANPGAEEVLGMTEDEITQLTYNAPDWHITDFDGRSIPDVQLPFRRVMEAGGPVYDVRQAIEWPNGQRVLLSVNAAPVFDGSDQADGVVFAIEDVTEQVQTASALRKNEEKYRSLVESTEDSIYLVDRDCRYLFMNQKHLSRFGFPANKVIGSAYAEFHSKEETKEFTEKIKKVIKTGKSLSYEYRSERGGGYYIRTLSPVTEPDGRTTAVTVVSKDITEHKAGQEALKESEASYRELADSIADVFFAMDKELRYTYWNKASEDLTGIPAEDAIGKSLYELFPDTSQTRGAERVYLEVLRKQKPRSFKNEYQLRGKDIIFEISAYPSKGGLSVFVKDITERVLAEERIKEQNKFLNSVLESLTHPFYVVDVFDYTLKMANSATNPGPLSKDSTCYALTHRRDRPCRSTSHPCPVDIVKKTKEPVTVEHLHYDQDGEPRHIEIHAYPVFDSEGSVCQIIECCLDITERKQAEKALRESERRLRFLSSQLIAAQEKERRRISLELHDEMGQALTAVDLDLAEIEKELPSNLAPAITEKLAETRSIVDQASEQIRELSLYLRPSMLDDLGLVPTLRWHLNRFSKRTNVEVKLEAIDLDERLDTNLETVLYRVVQEALNNVAKHAEAKKALVRLERKGEAIAIYIKDDGKGFDVNEILVRGAPEAGIGLLGMRERVAILGGSFSIQSRKRHGTQIIAEIPVGIED